MPADKNEQIFCLKEPLAGSQGCILCRAVAESADPTPHDQAWWHRQWSQD